MSQPPFQPPPAQQPPPMQRPPQPPPIQPKPPKQKRFGWLALILTAVIALGIGGAVGGSGDGATTAVPAAPTATATVTETAPPPGAEPAPTVTVTATAAPPQAKAKPKPKPEPELREGTYEVGKDVPAGRYKTTVPADSYNCYWERSKDDSGDSIITNANANPGARVSVTIKKGEFFTSEGCGDWVRQ